MGKEMEKENVHPIRIDVLIRNALQPLLLNHQPSNKTKKRGVDSSSSGAAQEPSVLR